LSPHLAGRKIGDEHKFRMFRMSRLRLYSPVG